MFFGVKSCRIWGKKNFERKKAAKPLDFIEVFTGQMLYLVVRRSRVDSRQQLVDSLVFTGLFSFCSALVNTYETVNEAEEPVARVTCPYCGREFTTDMDFKG